MRNFFDASSERRRAPRTKLAEIAYLGIGPENGGIVLDVSDGGLSFHSVAPVQPAESIRFLLSLKGHNRIEGSGEVVWTDEVKTVGGLKFTSLSAGAREHLDNWTNKTRIAAAGEITSASSSQSESPQLDEDQWPAENESVFAIPPAEEQLSPGPEDKETTIWQNPVFYWAMSGLLAAVLALASFLYGVHLGKSETRSVARTAPNPAPQANLPENARPPVPVPPVASNKPANPIPAPSLPIPPVSVPSGAKAGAPKTADISGSAPNRPDAEVRVPAMPNQRTGQAQEAGKSEFAAALAALNGDSGKRDSARAVKLLWAAVSKGNASAAVMLADLYVYGDGVPKNCEQGKILLKAAASREDAEAKVKLDELNANGCP